MPTTRGLIERLVPPPRFAQVEADEQARMFHTVGVTTLLLVTTLIPLVMLAEPQALVRGLSVMAVIDTMALITLGLNWRGRTRLAGLIYVVVVIALVTVSAIGAGGIRSPGVQAYLIFVLLAGLLLGDRSGVITGVVCATLGATLVTLERSGIISGAPLYGPIALWLLNCVYIGVALITMRLATRTIKRALNEARAELDTRRLADERLHHALEAAAVGVFELDPATGLATADARAIAMTGLPTTPQEPIAASAWRLLLHPDDRERVERSLLDTDVRRAGERVSYRLVHPTRGLRHVEAATYPVIDADGRATKIVGMIQDVTDRRHTELERERLLATLGERVKELRLLYDTTRLLRERETFDETVLRELVTRIPGAWLHPDECRARICFGEHIVHTPGWSDTPWRLQADFKTSIGAGRIEVEYARELPPADDGPFLREERELLDSIAELLRSHVEERAAEQQRRGLETQLREAQKMEALGTLAGGIAHDFNNILTAIGGNAEMARLDLEPESAAAQSLDEIVRAHARARDLVRRILLFSRRQPSARQTLALSGVVEEALRLLRASLPANIAIESEIAPDLPLSSVDSTQVHQVIMNLGTNAGYAMREHGGTLRVAIDTITITDPLSAPAVGLAADRYVRIIVRDTGSGMTRDVLERLFEPFFTTKGSAGTGLGLSVVHGIMRDHDGAIAVESVPQHGTTFSLYFPAVAATTTTLTTAPSDRPLGRGEHIFYVDDESALAFLMARTLSRLGYRCTEFTDPQVALAEFRAAPHDVAAVITDLQMPGMSGLRLLREIRAVRPDVPVAIASGMRDEAAATEVTAWINKPSTLDELSQAVAQLVRSA